MTTRASRILGWILAVPPIGMLLFSAYFKFVTVAGTQNAANMESIGMWQYRYFYGVLSIVSIVMLLIPRTSTVGYIFLVGYYAGAIATTLTHGLLVESTPLVVMLGLLTISGYMLFPELSARLRGKTIPQNF